MDFLTWEYYFSKDLSLHLVILSKQASATGVFLKTFKHFRAAIFKTSGQLLLNLQAIPIASTPTCLSWDKEAGGGVASSELHAGDLDELLVHMTIGCVLFIRSTWKLLFCIFSCGWLRSSYNFLPTRSITIADYSDLVYLLEVIKCMLKIGIFSIRLNCYNSRLNFNKLFFLYKSHD